MADAATARVSESNDLIGVHSPGHRIHPDDREQVAPLFTKVVAISGALFLGVVCTVVFFWTIPSAGILSTEISKHFLAVTGLPLSAIAATVVISMFRVTAGRIEFKALGFQFRGASGPVVLWVFCFLAFVAALRILWSAT
jgi:hypothetical protein